MRYICLSQFPAQNLRENSVGSYVLRKIRNHIRRSILEKLIISFNYEK